MIAVTVILLYKMKARRTLVPVLPMGQGKEDAQPAVGAPEAANIDESIEQGKESDPPLSGRLRYPENPELEVSGRMGGDEH